jgi:hypothetical protein
MLVFSKREWRSTAPEWAGLIGPADAVQNTSGETERTECEGKTDEDTNPNEHEGSSQNDQQYLPRLSTDGDAYADLTRSLNNRELIRPYNPTVAISVRADQRAPATALE